MALKFGHKKCFVFIISILLLTDIAILLNIPFLRQIIGFFFLTILPGLLILQILKLNKLDFLERFILTWGLSISFLMFFGLLINNSSFGLGYETPLATIPLLLSFNIAFIVLAIIGYKINKNQINTGGLHPSAVFNFSLKNCLSKLNLTTSEKAFLIVPLLFPALSIFGMHVMNTSDNNLILMLLLFLIPTYVVFVCFFNRKFPKRLYPVVIFLISISLLLLISLRSNHLIGWDVHGEYSLFRTTLNNLHWSVLGPSILNACLTISLLPTIYQSFLNVNEEYIFKILYALLFSVTPLIIFIISRKYVGELYAFLASFFFMSQRMFMWTAYSPRTNTAVLFFALAVMALLSDGIDALKKRILFIVFMTSVIVSHYSGAYIFFIIMLFCWLSMEILSKKFTIKKSISLTMVLLFFGMIFFWYSQVTETAFNAGVDFIDDTFKNLHNFFIIESRCERTEGVLGKGIEYRQTPFKIEFAFTWLTFVLIGIGVISMLKKYKEMVFIPGIKHPKWEFLKTKFSIEYLLLTLACVGLLVIMIAVPYVSEGYDLQRLYTQMTVVLSVVFVIGCIMLAKNLSLLKKALPKKQKEGRKSEILMGEEKGSQVGAYLIILLVLIPYFMCVTGTMYVIFGVPREITLSSEGEQYDQLYINDQELIAGEWLRSSNVVEGRLVNKQKTIGNMTAYLGMFNEKNRIYYNGGSEVWR